jgi:hypothetical protein
MDLRRIPFPCGALFLPLLFGTGTAQDTAGDLEGRVLSDQSHVVAHATITVYDSNSRSLGTAFSNEAGRFEFLSLPSGEYTVKATHIGFQTSTLPRIVIRSGKTTDMGDIQLVAKVYEQVSPVPESPPRATKTGAQIGGAVGVAAGIIVGLATPNEDQALTATVGAVLLGLAGAGIGALIGSTIPVGSSKEASSSDAEPSTAPGPAKARSSAALLATWDALTGQGLGPDGAGYPDTGPGFRGLILRQVGSGRFDVGLESGFSWVGDGLFYFGGVGQVAFLPDGVRPYGTAALRWDNWTKISGGNLLEAGVGVGLQPRLGATGATLQMEARYNFPLYNSLDSGGFSYVSLSLGPRLKW